MAFNLRPQGWALPSWVLFLRLVQGALALLILILTAVAASDYLGGDDPSLLVTAYPGFGFAWFAFSWTIVYVPVATLVLPNLKPSVNPLVILLPFELLTTLWWLVTFALLADNSSRLALWLTPSIIDASAILGLTRASAVFGAVEFVLFAVVSVIAIITLVKSRRHPGSEGAFVSVQEYPKESFPRQQPTQQPVQQQQQPPQPMQRPVQHPTQSELDATSYA